MPLESILDKLSGEIHMEFEVDRLEPLFQSEAEYRAFLSGHRSNKVPSRSLLDYEGNCYLGRRS